MPGGAGVLPTRVKTLLQLVPAAATPVGAGNLLGGVVVRLFSPLLYQTTGETLVTAPPRMYDGGATCVAALLEGIILGSAQLSRLMAARCRDVGGGGAAGLLPPFFLFVLL